MGRITTYERCKILIRTKMPRLEEQTPNPSPVEGVPTARGYTACWGHVTICYGHITILQLLPSYPNFISFVISVVFILSWTGCLMIFLRHFYILSSSIFPTATLNSTILLKFILFFLLNIPSSFSSPPSSTLLFLKRFSYHHCLLFFLQVISAPPLSLILHPSLLHFLYNSSSS